jgi:hypothetical protein
MKLDDEVIAHIAQLLQMAILTGTDIIDHLRMIELDTSGKLTVTLTDAYRKQSEENIDRMITEVENLSSEINS